MCIFSSLWARSCTLTILQKSNVHSPQKSHVYSRKEPCHIDFRQTALHIPAKEQYKFPQKSHIHYASRAFPLTPDTFRIFEQLPKVAESPDIFPQKNSRGRVCQQICRALLWEYVLLFVVPLTPDTFQIFAVLLCPKEPYIPAKKAPYINSKEPNISAHPRHVSDFCGAAECCPIPCRCFDSSTSPRF